MIEQKSSPKKQKVGSLFFHLFNRLSLWLYTLLINCFPARLLTSYHTLEARWKELCTRVLGSPDKKFRRKVHNLRLQCARLMEHSKILQYLDRLIRFMIHCPLNVYGIFFLIYGAIGAAVYFVADRLAVNYVGDIGWGIAGIVIAVASLPLLGTGKTLYRAAFGSRILGRILRSYLGLEPSLSKSKEKKERGGTLLVYAALVLAVGAGMLTFFFHPATVPIVFLMAVLAVTVLYIPESGVLLAFGSIGFWWITGYPVLCAIAIAAVTEIGYVSKLIRGKRVIHVQLMDFVVIMLMLVFALNGLLTGGDAVSTVYGIGYAMLIAMYFPTVNMIRSRDWLNRCYKLLAFSGAVLAVISVLPFGQILGFLDMTLRRVDFSAFEVVFERYAAYFGHSAMVGGMLMLLLPLMIARLAKKITITGFLWKTFWILTGCVSVFVSYHLGIWVGFAVAIVIFFMTYSYRSLSAAMLLAFPVTCGAVWYKDVDGLLGIRDHTVMQAVQNVVVTYVDSAAGRYAVANSVLQLSADHMLGVGFGDHAVQNVFPYYAPAGMESVTNIQNTCLQLLAECGYLGVFLLLAVVLTFIMFALTYLRWGGDTTTKARVAAGIAGIAGVMIMGLFCNLMNNASLFGLFWLVLGLSIACLRTQYEAHARAVQTHSGTMERTDIAFRTR